MINLDINESKKLKFKVSLSGIQVNDLKGAMRIMVENIEYGFPIKIENGSIVVEVDALSGICPKDKLKDGSLLEAKLELIAIDKLLTPWKDKIKVENPIKVEAKVEDIVDETKKLIPEFDISVSDISEEKITKKKQSLKESDKENKSKSRLSIMLEEEKN